MTAVLLALASAASFGAMTVAIRVGLRDGGARAARAALATLLHRVRRHAALRRSCATTYARCVAVLPRRAARARACRSSSSPRGARGRRLADVGRRRRGAALRARDRLRRSSDEPVEPLLVLGALAIVARRDVARRPSATGRTTCGSRGIVLRARRGGAVRGPRQHRPGAARARQPGDGRGGDDARRDARRLRLRAARCRRGASCGGSRRPACCSGSRTSASSRRTSTAGSRSSRRSSRPSRSGASGSRRSSSGRAEGGRAAARRSARCSSSSAGSVLIGGSPAALA